MKHHSIFLLGGLLLALASPTLAQSGGSVGIGTTTPNASAALDIVSSSKGVLLPRVSSTSSIASPATGLIVYQTGGTAGFYYYDGSSWQQLVPAGGAAYVQNQTSADQAASFRIGGSGYVGGSVGIGTTSPSGLLSITPVSNGTKIVLWDGGSTTYFHGFGISNSQLNYHVPDAGNSHVFYAGGRNGDGTELMRVVGSGRVGIGSSTPGQRLTVAGGIQAAASGAFSGSVSTDQGAHLQWNRSGSEGETWLINHLGLGGANAGIRFGGITTSTGTVPTEWARFLNNGNFGLGTLSPSALLDVNGAVRLRGLTAGVVTADASGNLSSSSATVAFGTSFVQNTTTQQASANFNIAGSGTVGGLLAGAGLQATAHPAVGSQGAWLQWNRSGSNGETWLLNQKGGGTTNAGIRFGSVTTGDVVTEYARFIDNGNFGVGDFSGTSAPSALLDVNGTVRLRGLATAGLVMSDASGNLSSAAPASLGTSFIQNQSSTQQSGSFNISGNATIAGSTSLGGPLTISAGGPAAGRVLTATSPTGATNWAYPGVLASVDVTITAAGFYHYDFTAGPSVRLLRVISATSTNQLNLNASGSSSNVENQELVIVNLQANSISIINSAQTQTVIMNLGQNQAARFIYAGGSWLREQ